MFRKSTSSCVELTEKIANNNIIDKQIPKIPLPMFNLIMIITLSSRLAVVSQQQQHEFPIHPSSNIKLELINKSIPTEKQILKTGWTYLGDACPKLTI